MKYVLFLVLFVLVFSLSYTSTSFGDHMKAEIDITDTKARQNFEVSADLGSEIVWTNNTSEPINITSGNQRDGPDGLFEITLLNPGESFSYKYGEDSIVREPFTNKEWYSQTHRNISGLVVIQVGEHSHEDGAHEDGAHEDGAHEDNEMMEQTSIDQLVKFHWEQFLKKLALQ